MERSLYENALMLDPVGAQTVMIALEDGEIDRVAAVLAWRVMVAGPRSVRCTVESGHSGDIV